MINEFYVKQFCCEDISLIKNYNLAINDIFTTWDIHHLNGEIYNRQELINLDLYYNRPASELIFITRKEHMSLHRKLRSWNRGRKNVYSQESLLKMSKAKKGKRKSINTKKKMSESHIGKPLPKNKWLTSTGEIVLMAKNNVMRFHKDWILLE